MLKVELSCQLMGIEGSNPTRDFLFFFMINKFVPIIYILTLLF